MPKQPPPSPPNRSIWAYALAAAVIWTLVAYDLLGPKTPPSAWRLAAAGQACPR